VRYELGSIYLHKGTGGEYVYLGEVKVKVSGDWKDGVLYQAKNNQCYVRLKENFEKAFVKKEKVIV
jgi:hypothetical protein